MDCITSLNSEFVLTIAKQAIMHYGAHHQIDKNIEEMKELISALKKLKIDFDKHTVVNTVDEVADVLFTTLQTAMMIGDSAVRDRIVYKAQRLMHRMEEEIRNDS